MAKLGHSGLFVDGQLAAVKFNRFLVDRHVDKIQNRLLDPIGSNHQVLSHSVCPLLITAQRLFISGLLIG